jgi:N-hydroxyarylamine O-acetyltransferase
MPHIDLESYFARVDYRGARQASLESLRELQAAHALAIPFENIDVIRGLGVRLDLPSIEQKLVHEQRGGYCFEQNALFAAVLEQLGFRVTPLAARVRWQIPAAVAMPLTHMVLRVDLGGVPYLADVGFGGLTPTAPLRLNAEEPQATPHETFRVLRSRDAFMLQAQVESDWGDVYRFTLEQQHPIDYELANWYTSRHPSSRFVQNLVVARPGRDRTRASLFNREFVVRRGAIADKRMIETPEELLEVLANQFGLRFPTGTRFGSPSSAWPA